MRSDPLSSTFAALADPTRRAILTRLASGEATVKELAEPFDMTLPAVTKHLKVLQRAGLIAQGRRAQWRPCRLEATGLREAADWVGQYRRFWDTSFDRLNEYLGELQEQEPQMTDANRHPGPESDRTIVVTRTFDAPRALVWRAWTDPEHLPRWMLGPGGWTMPVCEIDLRPGGSWHFVWRHDDGTEMEMRGDYREVVPPERLVSSESWGGDWPETLNTMTLVEEGGRTTLTKTILYPSPEARDAALGTGMNEGMAESFRRLDELLRTMR